MTTNEIAQMFSTWGSFYAMIGSSAAALTGLMFVVISLIDTGRRNATQDGLSTFSTPTVFHFCCVLFTAAVISAPFRSLILIAVLLGLVGAAGLLYSGRIAFQTAKIETYEPDIEDWLWHVLLPLVAYATFVVSAIALHAAPSITLYAPAAAAVLLIFIGIHNAWDVVTFMAIGRSEAHPEDSRDDDSSKSPSS